VGRENWGELRGRKSMGGAGQLGATRHPPLPTLDEDARHHLVTCGDVPR
jgi:hypothetical protein